MEFDAEQVPILNMVCLGEGNIVMGIVRFLGAPSLVICDGGGEFKGHLERGLEKLGSSSTRHDSGQPVAELQVRDTRWLAETTHLAGD